MASAAFWDMYWIPRNFPATALATSTANPRSPSPDSADPAAWSFISARLLSTRLSNDSSRMGDSEALPFAFWPGAGTASSFFRCSLAAVSMRFPTMAYFSNSLSARPETMLPSLSPAALATPGMENETSSARNWSVLCGIVAFHTFEMYERYSSPSRPVTPRRNPPTRSSSISSTTPSNPWAVSVRIREESRNALSVILPAPPASAAIQRAILPTAWSTDCFPAAAAAFASLAPTARPAADTPMYGPVISDRYSIAMSPIAAARPGSSSPLNMRCRRMRACVDVVGSSPAAAVPSSSIAVLVATPYAVWGTTSARNPAADPAALAAMPPPSRSVISAFTSLPRLR